MFGDIGKKGEKIVDKMLKEDKRINNDFINIQNNPNYIDEIERKNRIIKSFTDRLLIATNKIKQLEKGAKMYSCNTCKGQHNVGDICPIPIHKEVKRADFEAFLIKKFAEGEGRSCLDDDMIEAFDDWAVDLDVDDIIKYANEYANKLINKGA